MLVLPLFFYLISLEFSSFALLFILKIHTLAHTICASCRRNGHIIHWISTEIYRISITCLQTSAQVQHITAIRLGLNCQKILFKLSNGHKLTDFLPFRCIFLSIRQASLPLSFAFLFPSFPSNLLNLMVDYFFRMSPGSSMFHVLYITTVLKILVSNEVDTKKFVTVITFHYVM